MGFVGPIKWVEAEDTDACSDSGWGLDSGMAAGVGWCLVWWVVGGVGVGCARGEDVNTAS